MFLNNNELAQAYCILIKCIWFTKLIERAYIYSLVLHSLKVKYRCILVHRKMFNYNGKVGNAGLVSSEFFCRGMSVILRT